MPVEPYSYRSDAEVPAFDDAEPLDHLRWELRAVLVRRRVDARARSRMARAASPSFSRRCRRRSIATTASMRRPSRPSWCCGTASPTCAGPAGWRRRAPCRRLGAGWDAWDGSSRISSATGSMTGAAQSLRLVREASHMLPPRRRAEAALSRKRTGVNQCKERARSLARTPLPMVADKREAEAEPSDREARGRRGRRRLRLGARNALAAARHLSGLVSDFGMSSSDARRCRPRRAPAAGTGAAAHGAADHESRKADRVQLFAERHHSRTG